MPQLRALWLVALLALVGDTRAETPPLRVFFVGNSLTAAHDLPRLVAALAEAAGAPLVVDGVSLPGASLADHWDEGTARKKITGARWDVVVLQQGPSALPASRVELRREVVRWAALARAAGARPALCMVWPSAARAGDFPGVHDSYALAARDVGGIFLPAGDAWLAAWKIDPALPLYAEDRFHPSLAGSYLAALVIHATLAGRSPVGAPAPSGLAAPLVAVLQRAAAATVATPP